MTNENSVRYFSQKIQQGLKFLILLKQKKPGGMGGNPPSTNI